MDEPHAAVAVVHLKQAVNRRCSVVCQFTQPLGGAARGGTQSHAVIQCLVQAQNRVDGGRLAGAGAAGQHHDPAGQRQAYGLPLQRRVRKALRHFQHADVRIQRRRGLGGERRKLAEPRGNVLLGGEQVGQVDVLDAVKRAGAQFLGGEQLVERGFQVAQRQAEKFRRRFKQFIPRQAGVTVARVVPQRVEQPRRHPQAAACLKLQRRRDGVHLTEL